MRGSQWSKGLIVFPLRSNRQNHPPNPLTTHTHTEIWEQQQQLSSFFCSHIDVLLVSCYMFSIPQRVRGSGLASFFPQDLIWTVPYGSPQYATTTQSQTFSSTVTQYGRDQVLLLICYNPGHSGMIPAVRGIYGEKRMLIKGFFFHPAWLASLNSCSLSSSFCCSSQGQCGCVWTHFRSNVCACLCVCSCVCVCVCSCEAEWMWLGDWMESCGVRGWDGETEESQVRTRG